MPYFINADLDIFSSEDLNAISVAIGHRAIELHCGKDHDSGFLARYEIDDDDDPRDPIKLIALFCDLIESFPSEARASWKSANSRIIDLGYQSDDGTSSIHCQIPLALSERMTALQIELHMTFYPLEGNLNA